jgi:hypothetical protein
MDERVKITPAEATWKYVKKKWRKLFPAVGLIITIIGNFFMAYSVMPALSNGGAVEMMGRLGATIDPNKFQLGVYITIGGFIVQIIGTFL